MNVTRFRMWFGSLVILSHMVIFVALIIGSLALNIVDPQDELPQLAPLLFAVTVANGTSAWTHFLHNMVQQQDDVRLVTPPVVGFGLGFPVCVTVLVLVLFWLKGINNISIEALHISLGLIESAFVVFVAEAVRQLFGNNGGSAGNGPPPPVPPPAPVPPPI